MPGQTMLLMASTAGTAAVRHILESPREPDSPKRRTQGHQKPPNKVVLAMAERRGSGPFA